MSMPPSEKWREVERLFLEGLDIPPEHRSAWLIEECPSDGELREEVLRMWAADSGAEGQLAGVVVHASQSYDAGESLAGQRIGPYVLVREVGRGGMGAVYQAVRADGEFHQAVAIKIIKRGMDTDAILKRFRQERHILARLHHPNIARLLDAGTTPQGQPYLVMDYIEGRSLLEYCRLLQGEATQVLRRKLELFLNIAEAVAHAHSKLIIHRDLKPSNILVTAEGHAKLLDFGIAKWIDPALAPETAIDTMTGQMALTPDYASPEQSVGQPVTERTDVYGLGTILLEMSTGERAKTGAAKSLPHELQAIIGKAREKDPRDRYATVQDFTNDIANFLAQRPVDAYQGRWAYRLRKILHRQRAKAVLAAVATLSLIAVGWLWWTREHIVENPNSIAVLPFVNLTRAGNEEGLASGLSEDLIASLAALPPLRVLSRGAVQRFQGASIDAREAGRQLHAEAVLEGSIRQSGDQVRVVAQLISVRDGFHLWAQSYDRRATNLLETQQELSRLIAGEISTRLRREKDWRQEGRTEPQGEAYATYPKGEGSGAWFSEMPPSVTERALAGRRAELGRLPSAPCGLSSCAATCSRLSGDVRAAAPKAEDVALPSSSVTTSSMASWCSRRCAAAAAATAAAACAAACARMPERMGTGGSGELSLEAAVRAEERPEISPGWPPAASMAAARMEPKRLLPAREGRAARPPPSEARPPIWLGRDAGWCAPVPDARALRLPNSRLPPSERRMLTAPRLAYEVRSLPLGWRLLASDMQRDGARLSGGMASSRRPLPVASPQAPHEGWLSRGFSPAKTLM